MSKSILERIDAIVIVLERLASDLEIIRAGLEALRASLPQKYDMQRRLLLEQTSALERISMGLGMVQHTAASLGEIRSHAETIMREVEMLTLAKNGFGMVPASHVQTEDRHPMLEKSVYRFDQCIARIQEAAASLTKKTAESSNTEQRDLR